MILVTGARGHIGKEVCRLLCSQGKDVAAADLSSNGEHNVTACDIRSPAEISRVLENRSISAVVHLAAILPSAFRLDPLSGAAINLSGAIDLIRQAIRVGVKRFVFASSMSVYGSRCASKPMDEQEPACPDDPYGGSKRAIELVGECLNSDGLIEFVSLRIARVVGTGIGQTSSPWRSHIFEPLPPTASIHIPFRPEAILSLVHVEDVARMLITLAESKRLKCSVYNGPAELWNAGQLKETIERSKGIRVQLKENAEPSGPLCDGRRFLQEFAFQLCPLRNRLEHPGARNLD